MAKCHSENVHEKRRNRKSRVPETMLCTMSDSLFSREQHTDKYQYMPFVHEKDGEHAPQMPSTAMQKTVFESAKDGLLQGWQRQKDAHMATTET